MASCITGQVGNSYCPQIKLEVTVDSSYASNDTKAKLDWKLQYVAHGYAVSTSNSKSYTAVINGTTVASGSYAIGGKTSTNNIATGSVYIDRGTASKSISFSCSMNFGITWHGSSLGNKSASGSITLSAKTSYTVSYNVNGGSGSISSQTKWYGTNLTLSTTKPTKTGYTFKNWNTNSGGTGTAYSSGGTYSANASATLYAQYTANTYTVTYNANGGSGQPANQTKTYGVNLTLSSTKPTRTNYNFKGWATSSTGSVAYSSGATYSANSSITLYAVWELAYVKPRITNCTVTRCLSDGSASDEGTYAKVVFNWATDKTVTSVKAGYKTSGASSYTYTTISASGTSGSVSQVVGGSLSNTSEYLFDIVVADGSGTTNTSRSIPAMAFVVDFASGGKGMAIGCPADTTQNLLNIAWQTKLGGGSYVHRVNSTGGTAGYVKVATIVLTSAYADSGIHIKVIQRGDHYSSTLFIRFNGENSVDPAMSEFRCGGRFCNAYLVKSATSTWDLYVEKNGSYGSVGVVEYQTDFVYMRGKMNITWVNQVLVTDITTVVNSNATYTKALWGESPYLYQSDTDFVVGSPSRRMYFGSNAVPVVNQNGTTYTMLHSGWVAPSTFVNFQGFGLGLKYNGIWSYRQDSSYNVVISSSEKDTGGSKGNIYFRPRGTSDTGGQCIINYDGSFFTQNGIYSPNANVYMGLNNIDINQPTGTSNCRVKLSRNSDGTTYFLPDIDAQVRCGSTAKRWNICYASNGTSTSSDRTLKENIKYLEYEGINTLAETDDNITIDDCLDFITKDYLLATYNYIDDENKELKISAIAQDVIYNDDYSDNKIGQMIVDCEQVMRDVEVNDTEGRPTLGMNQTQLLNVAIGSIQALNKKVDQQQAIIEQQQAMIDELIKLVKGEDK